MPYLRARANNVAKGDRFWRLESQKAARRKAEAEGRIADSMDVRMALMERVRKGELTLDQAQAELARIKREAKANGKVTRAQAFQGY